MFCCFSPYRTLEKVKQTVGGNHARMSAARSAYGVEWNFEWNTTFTLLPRPTCCLWNHVCCFLFKVQFRPLLSFLDLFGPIAGTTTILYVIVSPVNCCIRKENRPPHWMQLGAWRGCSTVYHNEIAAVFCRDMP